MPIDADRIPATPNRRDEKLDRSESRVGSLRVYGIDLALATFGAYKNVNVRPCDFLRWESTYPVQLRVNGSVINPSVETPPTPLIDADVFGANMDPALGDVNIRPAFHVEIRRRIDTLGILIPNDFREVSSGSLPTGGRLILAAGAVEKAGWGLPIHHTVDASAVAVNAVEGVTSVFNPTLYGDNAVMPGGGVRRLVPHYSELVSLYVNTEYTPGFGGTLEYLRLESSNDGPTPFEIAQWGSPNFPTVPPDLHTIVPAEPVAMWPYHSRNRLGNGFRFFFRSSLGSNIADLNVSMNFRSWL